tara:strand:- start:97 stop:861 length:765 start_codon:yes stop_codon:yes gene_type:complete
MSLPSWRDLYKYHCTSSKISENNVTQDNPYYEYMSERRYNYSTANDIKSCRLVFLKDVLNNPQNKTLIRKGRFIWCKDLKYEGRDTTGIRQISFSIDKGQKRFTVSENNCLCVPVKSYINNNRFFRSREKTFIAFASVFAYKNTFNMMLKNTDYAREEFKRVLENDNPLKPGALVSPRVGYFYPEQIGGLQRVGGKNALMHNKQDSYEEHPCGIILGPSFVNDDATGREFYRVRFGDTTYERVHPVQLEIINEV